MQSLPCASGISLFDTCYDLAGARGGAAVRGRRGAEAAGEELPDPGGRGRDLLPGVRGDERARVHHRQRAAAERVRQLRHSQEHRQLHRRQVLVGASERAWSSKACLIPPESAQTRPRPRRAGRSHGHGVELGAATAAGSWWWTRWAVEAPAHSSV
ncbi:hypothetical protein VPH35_062994 [Triticum aestivum]